MRYRVGKKLGRTIYRIEDDEAWGDGTLIGIMDTAEDAAMVVEALNTRAAIGECEGPFSIRLPSYLTDSH